MDMNRSRVEGSGLVSLAVLTLLDVLVQRALPPEFERRHPVLWVLQFSFERPSVFVGDVLQALILTLFLVVCAIADSFFSELGVMASGREVFLSRGPWKLGAERTNVWGEFG